MTFSNPHYQCGVSQTERIPQNGQILCDIGTSTHGFSQNAHCCPLAGDVHMGSTRGRFLMCCSVWDNFTQAALLLSLSEFAYAQQLPGTRAHKQRQPLVFWTLGWHRKSRMEACYAFLLLLFYSLGGRGHHISVQETPDWLLGFKHISKAWIYNVVSSKLVKCQFGVKEQNLGCTLTHRNRKTDIFFFFLNVIQVFIEYVLITFERQTGVHVQPFNSSPIWAVNEPTKKNSLVRTFWNLK